MMDIVELTKKLISIPSCVDEKTNEKELGDFIYNYLKQFHFLTKIKRQKVEGERFNIIASDGFKPKLLLLGHLDTVEPRGWLRYSPFKPTIKGNKLYGLGSMDMKGGIAAILAVLGGLKTTKGLMLLFYCDEEYDFKGMKKFVQEYKISPQLAVCAEPTDLKIWNGARGIIKVAFTVLGSTAPASRPDKGKNAILGLVEAVKYLTEELALRYKSKDLGISTCNIAAISGGLAAGKGKKRDFIITQKGDAVADITQAILDVRASHLKLNAKIVKKLLAEFLAKNGFRLADFIIHHNLGAYYSRPEELKTAEEIIKREIGKVKYLELNQMGYQDIQMIDEKMHVPCFSFGPIGGNRHQAGEWVSIKSLQKLEKSIKKLIKRYC